MQTGLEAVSTQGKPNVVIVGSSFIGMEAASILAKQATVTVVGMEKVPFERVLGPKVGAALGKLTTKNGVVLKMESLVDRFEAVGEFARTKTMSKYSKTPHTSQRGVKKSEKSF